MVDFQLHSAEGAILDSADARSRGPLMFAFWKKSCGTCQFTAPFLQRFHHAYAGEHFRIWGISQENRGETLAFAHQFSLVFPQLLDAGLSVTEQYRLISVPGIYLTDHSGIILHHSAAFDSQALNRVSRLIAERLEMEFVPIVLPEDDAPAFKPG